MGSVILTDLAWWHGGDGGRASPKLDERVHCHAGCAAFGDNPSDAGCRSSRSRTSRSSATGMDGPRLHQPAAHSSLSLRPLVDPCRRALRARTWTRYVADLAASSDMVWLFACLPGDVWIAARVPWDDRPVAHPRSQRHSAR